LPYTDTGGSNEVIYGNDGIICGFNDPGYGPSSQELISLFLQGGMFMDGYDTYLLGRVQFYGSWACQRYQLSNGAHAMFTAICADTGSPYSS
jgi:hypothetical protein